MSKSANAEPPRRLTEDEAHLVLARAAELDARLPYTVSMDELWSSAEAAGISREAFAQATAELRAGSLARLSGRGAMRGAVARSAQLVLAMALFYMAFRTPDYWGWWIAQPIGGAWAVYGAYKTVGAIARWIGGGHRRTSHELPPANTLEREPRSGMSMAVRVLNLRQALGGAA